jgi:hypothetical protein
MGGRRSRHVADGALDLVFQLLQVIADRLNVGLGRDALAQSLLNRLGVAARLMLPARLTRSM